MKIISNNGYCRWKTKNHKTVRKNNIKIVNLTDNLKYLGGFANVNLILLVLALGVGFLYLYSMNGSAMQGYEIQKIEKDIDALQEESDQLKIREAELNSLYRLEEEGDNLDMQEVDDVVYIHNSNSIALK